MTEIIPDVQVQSKLGAGTKGIDLLPPSNDYVFCHLFGKRSHERVLTCLVNSILRGNPHIKRVKLDPTELKKASPEGKSIRLDVAATSDDGTIINIEIQCKSSGNIADRASFYRAKLRSGTLKEGEDYSSIPSIICIWICGESATNRKGCCHEIVDMYKENEIDPIEIASEKTRLFIIELPKLQPESKLRQKDMFTVWMQFIKDPGSIPEEFLEIPEVKEAMDELTYMSADPVTRAEYDARIKEQNDIYAGQSVKYKEGLAKGEEIGRTAEKTEMVKKMIATGLGIDFITEITGLTCEEVKQLENQP